MKVLTIIVFAAAFSAGLVCRAMAASSGLPPLQTVERLDIKRYLGDWYEIARYPNSFQKGCLGSSARYSLREDGEIEVLNSCRDAQDGRARQAKGRAWVVDDENTARLKVSFF